MLPYEGQQTYAFLSYAHCDWDNIEPILNRLQTIKPNIWWDYAINPGKWDKQLKIKIENCSLFIYALSEESVKRVEVLKEVIYLYRVRRRTPILPIIVSAGFKAPVKIGVNIEELNSRLLECDMSPSSKAEIKEIEKFINEQQIFDFIVKKEDTFKRIKQFLREVLGLTYSDGLRYTLSEFGDGYEVSYGACTDLVVTLPNEYDGKPVIGIKKAGFRETKVKKIIMPDSILYVDENAFYYCLSLKAIRLSNSLINICSGAFYNCRALKNIKLPKSTRGIGGLAFFECVSLEKIFIPENVGIIDKYAFEYCYSLTEIEVSPKNKTYSSVDGNLYSKEGTILDKYALGKPDKHFSIPQGVTGLKYSAVTDSENLTSVTIPQSLQTIGVGAFGCCKNLIDINFTGTTAEWKNIIKWDAWYDGVPATVVHCVDGDVSIR